MFLGDQTSPDDPGFVRVISDVLSRFHPQLRLNLISAGAPGQTAGGLKSRTLLDLLSSSRPDWLVINLALADATREPPLVGLLHQYRARMATLESDFDETLGPLHRIGEDAFGTRADSGKLPEIEWHRLPVFRSALGEAIGELRSAGVRSVLMTPVAVSHDLNHPLNLALRAYSRAIREVAGVEAAPLVDVDRAFRAVLERATNYKQKVSLADESGVANPQGVALIARTFLNAFGLLPQPGFRPLR
ncbi:MAG TPA: hypothetical protein VJ183_02400 [Chloroflexia bacterium]|nr:hypothetical protein [Chloroflexia bacterium]